MGNFSINSDLLSIAISILNDNNMYKATFTYEDDDVLGIAFNNNYLSEMNQKILSNIKEVYCKNFRLINNLDKDSDKDENALAIDKEHDYQLFYMKKENLIDFAQKGFVPKPPRKFNIDSFPGDNPKEYKEYLKIYYEQYEKELQDIDPEYIKSVIIGFFIELANVFVEQDPCVCFDGNDVAIIDSFDIERQQLFRENCQNKWEDIIIEIVRENEFDLDLADNPYVPNCSIMTADPWEVERKSNNDSSTEFKKRELLKKTLVFSIENCLKNFLDPYRNIKSKVRKKDKINFDNNQQIYLD